MPNFYLYFSPASITYSIRCGRVDTCSQWSGLYLLEEGGGLPPKHSPRIFTYCTLTMRWPLQFCVTLCQFCKALQTTSEIVSHFPSKQSSQITHLAPAHTSAVRATSNSLSWTDGMMERREEVWGLGEEVSRKEGGTKDSFIHCIHTC